MEIDRLEAELMRALEAVTECEKLAPAGLCTQWAQLAKVRIENALQAVKGK